MSREKSPRGRPRADLPALPDGEEPNAFARWLQGRRMDVRWIAGFLSVSESTVYGWRRGDRPPSRAMAARIERLSDGAVKAGDWGDR